MDNSAKVLGHLIVKNEDVETVGALIKTFEGYVQVKETDATADKKNYTHLHFVVSNYDTKEIFKHLAEFISLQDALDRFDLDEAKIAGDCVITRTVEYDFSSLHTAAHFGITEKTKYFLSKGKSGRTPPKEAAMRNRGDSLFETVGMSGKNEAEVGTGLASVVDNLKLDKLTGNALFEAVGKGDLEIVQMLIDIGLDVKSLDPRNKSTLLHKVARCNEGLSHYEVAEILLKMGVEVNARDDESLETPIHIMVLEDKSDLEFIELFLVHKPDLTLQDWNGETPLNNAIRVGNLKVVQLLIDQGADVNYVNLKNGQTPLHTAGFENNDLKIVKYLLISGADINAIDHNGYGPLVSVTCDYICEDVPAKSLNFLLKYSNINEGVNILEFVSELGAKSGHRNCGCKVIIIKHFAKLQALDLPIEPSILDSIRKKAKLSDYFDECVKELSLTKETKLRNSWITFFNLLVDNKRKLKNYAGNEDLVDDYKKSDWLKIFSIYGAEMQENMKKGLKRRELFDKSTLILSDLLPVFNPTHLVIQNVLDYVSTKELTKFCE